MGKRGPGWHVALTYLIVFAAATSGCNIFSALDPPGERQDKYAAGVALANAGECSSARDMFEAIQPTDDNATAALGWANLCIAGATAAKIATSIYSFSGGSTDLTGLGVLARSMLPMTSDKSQAVDRAIVAFNDIRESNRQSINVAIGQFVKAARILASQAGNASDTNSLTRTDVSAASCVNFANSCATVAGNCAAGMTATDVTAFSNAIAAAALALGSTQAADLKALATQLNNGVAVAENPARCFIFNQTVPST